MWYVNFETERDALAAFDYLREEVKTFKVSAKRNLMSNHSNLQPELFHFLSG